MKVHNFRDLIVWQKGMEVSKTTYIMTSTFPADEKYGLKSQMQRSAISIPSNIAEGSSRSSKNDYIRF